MKIFKSLVGRRQFMAGAVAASASALTFKKIGGVVSPATPAHAATTSQVSGATGTLGHFSDRYSHLLSPIQIGNVVLKNRMIFCNAFPKRHQGPENYPAWEYRNYVANLAKNGAAIVTLMIIESGGDSGHTPVFDLEDTRVLNYMDQLAEGVHCYNSLLSYPLRVSSGMPGGGAGMPAGGAGAPPGGMLPSGGMPDGTSGGGPPSGGVPPQGGMPEGTSGGAPAGITAGGPPGGMPGGGSKSGEVTEEQIEEAITKLKFLQKHGWDMVTLRRNGSTIPVDLYKAIKSECGQDFLIEEQVYLTSPGTTPGSAYGGGTTVEEVIATANQIKGLVDILQVKSADRNYNHPIGYTQEGKNKPLSLQFSEAIKKAGVDIVVAPNGGFQDLDFNEACIAENKCDMIAMGRAFICDHDYGKKAYEGRGEDVVPCVLCNKCHGVSMDGPWISACSVNPSWGITPATQLLEDPAVSRKVAVIGGGPGGMKAALVAAERGHQVTLYEKNDFLGGQLKHSDFASFQWPYMEYKNYLIRQLEKAGVAMELKTLATPEMIKAKGYDAVLVGVGADPIVPDILGADGSNVRAPVFVFGNEKAMGKNVVIVGGGDISNEDMVMGVATGIYLVQNGHNVTFLTGRKAALIQYTSHFPEAVIEILDKMEAFKQITEVTVTGISKNKVTYEDAEGKKNSVKADSVVVSVGRKPRREEAMKFAGSADRVIMLGDCTPNGGTVRKSTRSAYFAASQI